MLISGRSYEKDISFIDRHSKTDRRGITIRDKRSIKLVFVRDPSMGLYQKWTNQYLLSSFVAIVDEFEEQIAS